MSKRVLIILGIGVLLIVGAFFVHKKEVADEFETGDDAEPTPEPKPKKSKKEVVTENIVKDEPVYKESATDAGNETN